MPPTPQHRPRDPRVDRLFAILASRDTARETSSAEWHKLIEVARTHGVHPLFAQRVLSSDAPLPDDVRAALREIQQHTTRRNTLRLRDLTAVAGALHARGIPVIVLKGMHLMSLVYRNLAARTMVDVDLLVPAENLGEGAEAIQELGWVPSQPFRLSPGPVPYFEHQVPGFFKNGGATIELHWHVHRPIYAAAIDVAELWERAVPARIGSADVRVLTAEDLLLHVAAHATYVHRCEVSARACCDVAEIVSRHALAWDAVIERARRWNIANGTYLVLRLARELLGAPVPDDVLAALEPEQFDEQMMHVALRGEGHGQYSRRLRSAPSLRQKLRVARDLVFVRREELADSYRISRSSPLVYGLYFLRAARLLRRLPVAAKEFRGDGSEAAESAMVDAFLGAPTR